MALGADEVVRLEPSRDLLDLSPEQFVDQVLLPRSPALVVEGDDFHFGKGRAGNNRILARLGAARGFVVEVVAPVEVALDDQSQVRASSTVARWLIGNGRVRDAATVFGRPYTVEGITRRGDQRGRTIGYPTANVHSDHLLPADGVYGGTITLADRTTHRAAINVGNRPTFGGTERRIEVFAMDAQGGPAALPAAYDWPALVTFEHWVREDLRFHSLEGLVGQIGRDVRAVQAMAT